MKSLEGSLGQKLVSNTIFNFFGQFYILALGFLVVPYMVRRLGAEAYGLVALVAAIGGFAGLLNLGVGKALAKRVSELYWKGDLAPIRSLFQTTLAVSLLAGIAAVCLLIGFRDRISAGLFHVDAANEQLVSFALCVTGFGVLISLVSEMLYGLAAALQRFDVCNRINAVVASVTYLGSVLALALGSSVRGVLLVFLLAQLVGIAAYARFLRRTFPALPLRPAFDWETFRTLAGFSFFVLVAGASALVVHRLDRILVAYYLPMAAVAFYTIPYALAEKAASVAGNLISVIFPSASELSSMLAAEKLRELYLRGTKMVLLAVLPGTVLLALLPEPILRFWVGQEFAARGAVTLQLLALGFFFNVLGYVPFVIAQGIGRPSITARFSVWNGVVNLLLFVLFIPRYGITGAAAAFLLSEILVIPLFVHSVSRHLGVGWKSLVLRGYLPAVGCAAVAAGTLSILSPLVHSLSSLLVIAGLGMAIYALAAVFIALDSQERTHIQFRLSLIWKPAS